MKHTASTEFWFHYRRLQRSVQRIADRSFELLAADQAHPSLHFKRIGPVWSVRVGIHQRAPGLPVAGGVHWFWIGTHADYDKLIA